MVTGSAALHVSLAAVLLKTTWGRPVTMEAYNSLLEKVGKVIIGSNPVMIVSRMFTGSSTSYLLHFIPGSKNKAPEKRESFIYEIKKNSLQLG